MRILLIAILISICSAAMASCPKVEGWYKCTSGGDDAFDIQIKQSVTVQKGVNVDMIYLQGDPIVANNELDNVYFTGPNKSKANVSRNVFCDDDNIVVETTLASQTASGLAKNRTQMELTKLKNKDLNISVNIEVNPFGYLHKKIECKFEP
jgi:hypothetical protein